MDFRKGILDVSHAVQQTLEKGRPEYDASLRRIRWGELPIYCVGAGHGYAVAHFAASAFETLLEWPCGVRAVADFAAYSAASVRPRTIALLISSGEESPDLLAAAKLTRARSGIALVMTPRPEDPLAGTADGVFLVRAGEERGGEIRLPICQQAACGSIALLAAKALKRHRPQHDSLEEEFTRLPAHLDWALSQLGEGVRSLASELARAKSLAILAGGSYYSTALLAVSLLRKLAGIRAVAINAAEMASPQTMPFDRDESLLVLSGSRCGVKRHVHAIVEAAKRVGASVLSISDANEPELARRSALSLLLPVLNEITGATLAHALMAWTAYHAGLPGPRKL
jgi:fructoselysine-6-P-deglycase FrlB-like protein